MIDLKDQDNLFLATCSTNRSHIVIIPVSLQVSVAENSLRFSVYLNSHKFLASQIPHGFGFCLDH